jgi:aryl-phospho-beta-D-glucosidase BglC (GH1 family)
MDLGINLAGAESADPNAPSWAFPTEAQIDYYAAKGFSDIRLPLSWELLQHSLNGPLDSEYLSLIQKVVTEAAAHGMRVILDIHNYGAYDGNLIGSAQTPISAFADMWGKLSGTLATQSNVVFDLMNEPQQPTASAWLPAVNAAIAAIRDTGATQQVLVSGIGWDGGQSFTTNGNSEVLGTPGAVVDPLNNFAFEIHQYLDDTSGQNSWVVSSTIGVERLEAVTDWARASGYKLYLGEFGVASNSTSITAMVNMLNYVSSNQDVWEGAAYWGGGNLPTGYIYSSEPQFGLIDAAQVQALEAYSHARTSLSSIGQGQVEADTYVNGGTTPSMVDILNAAGQVISRAEDDLNGNLERKIQVLANGDVTVTSYAEPASSSGSATTTAQKAMAATPQVTSVVEYNHSQQRVSETDWQTNGVSTKTTFDTATQGTLRQETYGADGVVTATVAYNSDSIVTTAYVKGQISVVQTFSTAWSLEAQDSYSNGILVSHQVLGTNTISVEQYNLSGVITSRAIYDSQWHLQSWAAFDAAGHEQSVTTYAANGHVASVELHQANGSNTVQSFDATTQKLTSVDQYDANGLLQARTTYDGGGHVVTIQQDNVDGSYSVATYSTSNQTSPRTLDQFDAHGAILSRATYDPADGVTSLDVVAASGSHLVTTTSNATQKVVSVESYTSSWTLLTRATYDTQGHKLVQSDNSDGTHTIETYASAQATTPQTRDTYDASWSIQSRTTLDANGNVAFIDAISGGGHTVQIFDPASHTLTGEDVYSSAWNLLGQVRYTQGANGLSATDSAPTYTAANGEKLITLTGSAQTFTANGLGDQVTSNETGNHLIGGAGNDVFIIGGGGDVVTGNGGADSFVFRSLPHTASQIADFTHGQDTLDLSGVMSSLGYTGTNPVQDHHVNFVQSGDNTQVWVEGPYATAWTLLTTLDHVSPSIMTLMGHGIYG